MIKMSCIAILSVTAFVGFTNTSDIISIFDKFKKMKPLKKVEGTYLKTGLRYNWGHFKKAGLSIAILDSFCKAPLIIKNKPKNGKVDYKNLTSFMHYNPKAISQLNDSLKEKLDNALFKKSLDAIYTSSCDTIHAYYFTYKALQLPKLSKILNDDIILYKKQLKLGGYASSNDHMKSQLDRKLANFCKNHLDDSIKHLDWYDVNTAVKFWMRRRIDGSEKEFYQLLCLVVKTFEPALIGIEHPKPDI